MWPNRYVHDRPKLCSTYENKFQIHLFWLSDLPAVSPGHSSTADPKPWMWSPAAAR